jgi:putative transposase
LERRRAGVKPRHPSLSVTSQCHLLKVSRSGLYYQPVGVSQEDLALMKLIDRQYMATPFYGARRMVIWLDKSKQHLVNRKHVRRLMAKMGLKAIYPRPKTSAPDISHKVYPYLLNGLKITRPNQVWATDITFIPMARGFLYLVAIMDWYSRQVLSWRLSNTLDAGFCVEALEEALRHGKPDTFNTDQGSQFTGGQFTRVLERHGIRISMDGKGSHNDNLFIERLWRTVKYEEVYLKAYQDGREARAGIGNYFRFYNNERPHQALGYRTPAEVFNSTVDDTTVDDTPDSLVESLALVTLRTAGLHLNLAPVLS